MSEIRTESLPIYGIPDIPTLIFVTFAFIINGQSDISMRLPPVSSLARGGIIRHSFTSWRLRGATDTTIQKRKTARMDGSANEEESIRTRQAIPGVEMTARTC